MIATPSPADLDLRRRRVLGFEDKHLWPLIYRTTNQRFVARLADATCKRPRQGRLKTSRSYGRA